MITWLNFWPVMLAPTTILSVFAALPTHVFNGRVIGGGPIREYYLNHFVLPLLSNDTGRQLVEWFSTASTLQEWLLAFVVAININAALLPLLYALGVSVIRLSSWKSKKDIDLKRQAMR